MFLSLCDVTVLDRCSCFSVSNYEQVGISAGSVFLRERSTTPKLFTFTSLQAVPENLWALPFAAFYTSTEPPLAAQHFPSTLTSVLQTQTFYLFTLCVISGIELEEEMK